MTNTKPRLLLVDDEPRILRSLAMIFRQDYQIFTAENGHEALSIIANESIHVIVSDQRMPVMLGSELLKEVKKRSPDTMRLLLTGYSELNAIINSINEGEIFRYISKPWDKNKLIEIVDKATRIALQTEQKKLKKTSPTTSNKASIPNFMVLDRDQSTHDLLKSIVGNQAKIFHHDNIDTAIDTMTKENVAILISDIQLDNQDISDTLNYLKQENPNLVTIVMTEFNDSNKLIDLINHGQIYRFLPKPARKGILIQSIKSGIKNYRELISQPVLAERIQAEPLKQSHKDNISRKLMDKIKKLRNRSQAEQLPV